MKKQKLLKTLLVAVGLCAGASAWADDTKYNINSSESAYVDATNDETKAATHNGASLENLIVYNVQVRNWVAKNNTCNAKFNTEGKMALYKFPLSSIKSAEGNIKSATLKITVNSTGDGKSVSKFGVFGYNGAQDWTGATMTYTTLSNTGANELGYTVNYSGTFPILDENNHDISGGANSVLSVSVRNYLKSAMEDSRDYISFAVANNSTRTANLKVSAELEVVYTTDAEYTVNFVDASDNVIKTEERIGTVGAALTLADGDSDPIYTGGKKYIYTGNDAGTRTIDNGVVLKISFREAATYSYSVKTNLGATIVSDTGFEGDSKTVSYNKYVLVDGTLYEAAAIDDSKKTFSTTFTLDADNKELTITYNSTNITNVTFYTEGEDIDGVTKVTNGVCDTRGSGRMGAKGSNTLVTTLTPGSYQLLARFGGKKNKSFYVYVGENAVIELDGSTKASTDGLTDYTAEFTITENTTVKFSGGEAAGSAGNSYGLDYIYVKRHHVSGTIASSGYSSLASAYGLDFAHATGLNAAYVVTATTNDAVTLTSVDELPANQGVILKGTASTAYSIPVKADATYDGINLLKAGVEAYNCAANEVYILQGGEFCLVSAASTVPAGKAYLLASDVPTEARSLGFLFGDETTAISAVGKDVSNGVFYNLNGQRVDSPKKGLYIVNGKKVIIK